MEVKPGSAHKLVGQDNEKTLVNADQKVEDTPGASQRIDSEVNQEHTGGMGGAAVTAQGMAGQQNLRMDGEKIPSQGMDKHKRECASCNSEELRRQEILQTQSKRPEDEINNVKKTGVGRMARVFKLKQMIVGNKKAGQEPAAIKDPETGDMLVASSDIRRASLNYCVNNLKNNEVSKNVKVIVALKENLHNMRME